MLLKTLKSNQPYHILLIPLIAIALWIRSFINPVTFPFYHGEDMMILYQPLDYLLKISPVTSNIVALAFTILLSLLIYKLNVQYAFIRVKTVLPASLFILITSGMHTLHAMHPVYPAALFLILTIDRIFSSYNKPDIHSNAFEAGIFMSIGSLFYLNLIFFFPFLWIGFIILNPKVNWREYVLTTLGFIFPWVAAFVYYLISDRTDELIHIIETNIIAHQSYLRQNLPIQIYIGFLVFLTLLGSVFILAQYDEKKISSRKYFKAFFWVYLITAVLLIGNPAVSQEIIIILAIPLTYLISNYLIFMKRQLWGEVFLYLLTVAIILLQFI